MTDARIEEMPALQRLAQAMSGQLEEQVRLLFAQMAEELSLETKDRIDRAFERIERRLDNLAATEKIQTKPIHEDHLREAIHLNDYGVQLFYRNQVEQAAEILEDATRVNPDLVEAWSNLAVVFTALGKTERAVQAFRVAAELDPNRTEYLNNQAVLHLLEAKTDKALELLEQAVAQDSLQKGVLLNLAQAYLAVGRHKKAVDCWRTILAIDPAQDEALRHLRQYYL